MSYRVYAATKKSGVFYSSDFELDSSNPTWTPVSDGLPNGNIFQFVVDYIDLERTQYVLHRDNYEVYRRQDGGSWELVLSAVEARNIANCATGYVGWITSDEYNEGVLYALFSEDIIKVGGTDFAILQSVDYGANWSLFYSGNVGIAIYNLGNIIARGDDVWFTLTAYITASRRIWYLKGGLLQGVHIDGGGGGNCWLHWDNNDAARNNEILYFGQYLGSTFGVHNLKYDAGFVKTPRHPSRCISEGNMWYSKMSNGHFRVGDGNVQRLHYTTNAWSSVASNYFGTLADVIQVTNAPDNDISPVLGISAAGGLGSTTNPLLFLDTEASTTPVYKAGANWNVAPYANSIPVCSVSEGICHLGIFFLPLEKRIYVHAVEGEPSIDVEDPLPSDRSAFNDLNYPHRHSLGLREAIYVYHVPRGNNIGDILIWNGNMWVPQQPGTIVIPVFADVIATPVSTGIPEYVYAGSDPVVASI